MAPVVEATGLLSSSLPIALVAVEMVIAVDMDIVPGSWAFGSPFMCARLMGGIAEWSITMLPSAVKDGIAGAEGASPISKVVEWSAIVPMLALEAKEGITEGFTNEEAVLIAGWSTKDTSSIGTTPAM